MVSQSHSLKFRNNPENFHPGIQNLELVVSLQLINNYEFIW